VPNRFLSEVVEEDELLGWFVGDLICANCIRAGILGIEKIMSNSVKGPPVLFFEADVRTGGKKRRKVAGGVNE
jgi:hypothetical protein